MWIKEALHSKRHEKTSSKTKSTKSSFIVLGHAEPFLIVAFSLTPSTRASSPQGQKCLSLRCLSNYFFSNWALLRWLVSWIIFRLSGNVASIGGDVSVDYETNVVTSSISKERENPAELTRRSKRASEKKNPNKLSCVDPQNSVNVCKISEIKTGLS